LLDPAGGDLQEYVEDCEVCCRPWRVEVTYDETGAPSVELFTDDE
ncbi:MAG: Cysteine-rich, partial [Gemmatimonadota bacterium]